MKTVLSFSGGKDSCFALHQLQKENIDVACLLTTVWKVDKTTVAHSESLAKMKEQANSLQIPIYFMETDFNEYGTDFVNSLKEIKMMYRVDEIAFGDIYLQGHREWGENIAAQAKLKPYYPLWSEKQHALSLLRSFVDLNFKAVVTKVDDTKLPADWVGRPLDATFITDISHYDVCPMGESGEYHTFVQDGPIFSYPVHKRLP